MKNLDSGIGVYAGSHDSYVKFNKLFDPIILNYHQHPPGAAYTSDMSSKGLKNAIFSDKEADYILSTRIRVGRNLEWYPLNPGVSKEQRLEIMDIMVEACNTFGSDL